MADERIRLLIAEDHQIMREGLMALFSQHESFHVVGQVDNGSEAVQAALDHGPDVVLMDVGLPRLNGIEATQRIHQERPDVFVLMLTMHDDATTVDRALRAGARGFVVKGSGFDVLYDAIHTVHRGEVYLHPGISHFVLQGYLQHHQASLVHETLTRREREILQLIAEGHTSADIADLLEIKTKTVQNYRAIILDKLGEQTTAGLVRYAIKAGVVQA